MKIYHSGDWEYWYDRSTRCWWTALFEQGTGIQIGDAIHAYTRAEIEQHVKQEIESGVAQ